MDLHEETDSESEDKVGPDISSPEAPPSSDAPTMSAPEGTDIDVDPTIPSPCTPPAEASDTHTHLCCPPEQVQKYPSPAGAPVPAGSRSNSFATYQSKVPGATEEIFAPFKSQMDWEVARWAKLRGSGSTAFSDLLKIAGVSEKLGLSYRNSQELNSIIDNSIPSQRPQFTHREVTIAGESFDIFSRDIIKCIRALYSDPEHAPYLCFSPKRHYTDADQTERLYHDMHTGKWWWDTQVAVEARTPGATIIPIIISSDKTQLTLFRNKSAYPVYLTIGNLPKSIRRKPSRRGQILLAYLPTTNLSHIKNKSSRRRALSNLFHACMQYILSPLETAGVDGIVMRSGDGVARRCHPIFACFVGDYPEQCLVTGTFSGQCPICLCPHNELGDYPCEHPFRSMDDVRRALNHVNERNFARICKDAQLRPVRKPFWSSLPFVNIYASITPDILHQLHQGVMKHLISWLGIVCGEEEFDERVKRLPPNHGMRIFHKGVTSLSRLSGTEHKQIASFLLGLLIDIPLKTNFRIVRDRLIQATRALLDFLYIAQYPVHSDASLALLDQALFDFHENKAVFVTLEAREDFLIPKLHSLTHYSRAIRLFGTTDNYSTESTERLHIDFAKDAYAATNHKDEFPQMTRWLERREKILFHEKFILWRMTHKSPQTVSNSKTIIAWEPPDMGRPLCSLMTKHPTRKVVHFTTLTSPSGYNAPFFVASLTRYLILLKNPKASSRELARSTAQFTLPFNEVAVYHKMKLIRSPEERETLDSIHVNPGKSAVGTSGAVVPPRCDTALIRVRPKSSQNAMASIQGTNNHLFYQSS
ncbi:hypothetical protein ONZ45_g12346 [Pleurotus djamor]|nr:hypothetical protein ONZ45_g12346 [Pleurotus djamor]